MCYNLAYKLRQVAKANDWKLKAKMSALPHHSNWTVQEYLNYERTAADRHEFVDGQIYAMAGAPERHHQIVSAVHYTLYGQVLERPCQVFQSDMRVQVAENVYFYPDVVVVCGDALYTDATRDTLLNPTAVVEVLSPSTEDYDRGSKFMHYRALSSLQAYVLVSQKNMHVERYLRQNADQWILTDFTQPDSTIDLPAIGCTLLLRDVYRKVNFDDEPDKP